MFCPECGAINDDKRETCFICGAPLHKSNYESDLDALDQMSQETNDMIHDLVDNKDSKKRKLKISDKVIIFFVLIVLITMGCSCLTGGFAYLLSQNEDAVLEYAEENGLIDQETLDAITSQENDNNKDESSEASITSGMTEEEFRESVTYDMFELETIEDDTVEIQLPSELQEVEVDESEEYTEGDDLNVRSWKYGEDYDVIQIGTFSEFNTMEEAADIVYDNAIEAEFCSDMQIEDDTISGYPAIKISGYDYYNHEYLVMWIFEAPDKDDMVHYFAADVLISDMVLLEAKDTYVYKGMSSESVAE